MNTIGAIVQLSTEEFEELGKLSKQEQKTIFTTGFVDYMLEEIVLFRYDQVEFDVPFSFFNSHAKCSPDFEQFSIIDYGHAIKLGEFECTSRAILAAFDSEYKLCIN